MRCTPWIWVPLSVALVAGCSGDRRHNDTAGSGTETGTMPGGAATSDTAVPSADTSATTRGMSSDTAHADAGMHRAAGATPSGADSAKANQTKSGVTNPKTGKSTLGKGVTQTRPDQGQPVTSKGDTVSAGPDSAGGNQ
jgi:hypothetical protein